ncbi:AAA family ATPase [Bariatricus sp. SGI.154]|uniref:cytidylate kinase-like family protein n=1 Tax=Bariatricus sp. SGI.154 TaxID=3420549 RepID=UPI003D07EF35
MAEHKIVTIGRQFGSGGHEIGNILATRLDIPLYDNNLVRMVAEKLDIREETARAVDETTLNSFLAGYVIAPIEYTSAIREAEYTPPLNEQVYELQSDIIRRLSERGPCVIVGRCADYVLQDNPNCINVFICADLEDRIQRIAKRYDLSEKKAADKIKKIDRERKYYYESHTGLDWGSVEAHQVLLNVSRLGMERTVDILEMMYRG